MELYNLSEVSHHQELGAGALDIMRSQRGVPDPGMEMGGPAGGGGDQGQASPPCLLCKRHLYLVPAEEQLPKCPSLCPISRAVFTWLIGVS